MFRLKLDMSSFFKDERNTAYVLINPNWDYVKDLIEHIEKIFEIKNIQLLTEDSCYLSPLESIEIIEKNDLIRPISLNINEDKRKKKPVLTEVQTEKSSQIELKDLKNFSSKTVKKHKQSGEEPTNVCKNTSDKSSVENVLLSKTGCSNNQISISSESESEVGNMLTRTKRKRKRIRQPKHKAVSDSVLPVVHVIDKTETSNSTTGSSNNTSNFRKPSSHLRFDNIENNKKEIIWKNALDGIDNSPRQPNVISLTLNDGVVDQSKTKNKVHIIENKLLTKPRKEESRISEISNDCMTNCLETHDTETVKQEVNGTEKNQPQFQTSFKISDVLPHVESLEGPLKSGDLIVFKVTQDNDEGFSDYICGKFIEIDAENKNVVKLLIVDGHKELNNKYCRFPIKTKDGTQTEYFKVILDDMHEVGILKFEE